MKLSVDVDFDQALDITRATLLQMLYDLESLADPANLDRWDAINEVLAYISTDDELEEMSLRDIPSDFVDILLKDTLNNFYKGLQCQASKL